ncbi:MAG: porin [Prevotella sp.]|nr:porin [Prevotella sp.]
MKKVIFIMFLSVIAIGMKAQEQKATWINNVKLSGYGMTQYQMSTLEGAKENSFNLRLARLALDGRIMNDFYWKVQIQINGNTSTLGSSPRLVDLFAEWQKYDFACIKVGQFKRPFTFENPMHPITQGFMSYSQPVNNLAGFSDRAGGHASNGRDIGVQLQGDLLKTSSGRPLIHYQVGVFNGQGINMKDVDQQKDLIGGLWVMPVKGMRIGAFGWTGSYARKGTWTETDAAGNDIEKNGVRSLSQRRYAISADYNNNDWTFRTEYVHSTGKAFKTRYQKSSDGSDCTLSGNGDKADGYYALVIAPIIKQKVHAKARYDLYRPTADWDKAKTFYEVGADWLIHKNFQINLEYALVNDRSLAKHNYSMVDVEVDFKF